MLWDLLFAAGRHSEALRRIALVHEAVTTAFGAGSIEQRMMDVRLGVSIAGAHGWKGGRIDEPAHRFVVWGCTRMHRQGAGGCQPCIIVLASHLPPVHPCSPTCSLWTVRGRPECDL